VRQHDGQVHPGDRTLVYLILRASPPIYLLNAECQVKMHHVQFLTQAASIPIQFQSKQPIQFQFYNLKIDSIRIESRHPSLRLNSLLPHGKQYQSAKSVTKRLMNSFYHQAIRLLIKWLPRLSAAATLFIIYPDCYVTFTPTFHVHIT
jgi:hypothetical protein